MGSLSLKAQRNGFVERMQPDPGRPVGRAGRIIGRGRYQQGELAGTFLEGLVGERRVVRGDHLRLAGRWCTRR